MHLMHVKFQQYNINIIYALHFAFIITTSNVLILKIKHTMWILYFYFCIYDYKNE